MRRERKNRSARAAPVDGNRNEQDDPAQVPKRAKYRSTPWLRLFFVREINRARRRGFSRRKISRLPKVRHGVVGKIPGEYRLNTGALTAVDTSLCPNWKRNVAVVTAHFVDFRAGVGRYGPLAARLAFRFQRAAHGLSTANELSGRAFGGCRRTTC